MMHGTMKIKFVNAKQDVWCLERHSDGQSTSPSCSLGSGSDLML